MIYMPHNLSDFSMQYCSSLYHTALLVVIFSCWRGHILFIYFCKEAFQGKCLPGQEGFVVGRTNGILVRINQKLARDIIGTYTLIEPCQYHRPPQLYSITTSLIIFQFRCFVYTFHSIMLDMYVDLTNKRKSGDWGRWTATSMSSSRVSRHTNHHKRRGGKNIVNNGDIYAWRYSTS